MKKNMKKRVVSGLIIMSMILAATGCSGGKKTSVSSEKLTGEDDPKKILVEVEEFYNNEELWGSETTMQYYYLDGSQEEETMTVVVDNKKGLSHSTVRSKGEISYESFSEKKGEEVYYYSQQEGKEWVRYKTEKSETENESSEEDLIFNSDFYNDIQYTNEGEEKLDGTDTVKIKVTASWGVENSEPVTTREEVIAQNEWTEEAIAATEGFSELLDRYVDALNASASAGSSTNEYLIWVDVNTHKPVKEQETIFMGNVDDSVLNEAEKAMWDASWEVSIITNNMAVGMSLEEAKEIAEINRAEIEADIAASGEDRYAAESDMKIQDRIVDTRMFLLGEACPKLGELPAEYKEITQEQYYNGDY